MAKTLFQHVDAIFTDQSVDYFDSLDDGDKKTFNPFMVHRCISMTMDYLPVVNEIQKYHGQLDSREVYLVYSQLLPKKKMFSKYVKGKNDVKYEDWLVELVSKEYAVNTSNAKYYLSILYQSDHGKDDIRTICQKYGVDDKLIRKLKL